MNKCNANVLTNVLIKSNSLYRLFLRIPDSVDMICSTSRTNGRRVTYMLVIRYLIEEDGGDYLCTITEDSRGTVAGMAKKIGKLTYMYKVSTGT